MREETVKMAIEKYSLAQKKRALPCPSCGSADMDPVVCRNAMSRLADIFVCSTCGSVEALRSAIGKPQSLNDWFLIRKVETIVNASEALGFDQEEALMVFDS